MLSRSSSPCVLSTKRYFRVFSKCELAVSVYVIMWASSKVIHFERTKLYINCFALYRLISTRFLGERITLKNIVNLVEIFKSTLLISI